MPLSPSRFFTASQTLLIAFLSLLAVSALSARSNHTNNWAVIVCTSRYWFNYRHTSNALSIYRTVKRLGIPDSHIILMLPEVAACNPRNSYRGQVFNDGDQRIDLFGTDVEVDYRGYEVTVENFIRVLTGRHNPAVPQSKRLLSDKGSNILIYLTGHGGNEFLKFQDHEEIMAQDVADAVQQMYEKGRYNEILLMAETCQAATLYSRVSSPGVLAAASSRKGESSYSYLSYDHIGLSLIDRFTNVLLQFFEGVNTHSKVAVSELFPTFTYDKLESNFHYRADLFRRPLQQLPVTDFFGSVAKTIPDRTAPAPYVGGGQKEKEVQQDRGVAAPHIRDVNASQDGLHASVNNLSLDTAASKNGHGYGSSLLLQSIHRVYSVGGMVVQRLDGVCGGVDCVTWGLLGGFSIVGMWLASS